MRQGEKLSGQPNDLKGNDIQDGSGHEQLDPLVSKPRHYMQQ